MSFLHCGPLLWGLVVALWCYSWLFLLLTQRFGDCSPHFVKSTLVADVSLRGGDLCAVCDSRRLRLVSTENGSMASSSTRPTHYEKEGSELACFTSVVLCKVLRFPFCVLFENAVFCIFFILAHAVWSSCTILVYHQRFLASVAGALLQLWVGELCQADF